MNKVTVGRWTISKGKGERYYINLKNSDECCVGAMHPEQLAEINGCGVYGIDELSNLSFAIQKFKAQPFVNDTIHRVIDSLKNIVFTLNHAERVTSEKETVQYLIGVLEDVVDDGETNHETFN